MKAYLVDIGILLDETDREFDFYSCVYDHKYGYYDTNQYYVSTLEQAKKEAQEYVNQTLNSYGIISITELEDGFDFEDCCDVREDYLVENIEYSICNTINGIKEDFVVKQNELFQIECIEESEADKKTSYEWDKAWEEEVERRLED